jgi:uncharacterized protein
MDFAQGMVKIAVLAKPNSKKEAVIENEDGSFTVRFNTPPIDGKANIRIVELLSKHFGVPKSCIQISKGLTSKKKIIIISE